MMTYVQLSSYDVMFNGPLTTRLIAIHSIQESLHDWIITMGRQSNVLHNLLVIITYTVPLFIEASAKGTSSYGFETFSNIY